MAVFLLKSEHGAQYAPPPATGTVFADVAGQRLRGRVDRGARGGRDFVGVRRRNTFCPGAPVTRAQMAVFLLKASLGPAYAPPAATGTVFADVPASAFAASWIEDLAARGITSGCGGGHYCPAKRQHPRRRWPSSS